jgi:hypothetical protein
MSIKPGSIRHNLFNLKKTFEYLCDSDFKNYSLENNDMDPIKTNDDLLKIKKIIENLPPVTNDSEINITVDGKLYESFSSDYKLYLYQLTSITAAILKNKNICTDEAKCVKEFDSSNMNKPTCEIASPTTTTETPATNGGKKKQRKSKRRNSKKLRKSRRQKQRK